MRALNDSINQLSEQRQATELKIREAGGGDYTRATTTLPGHASTKMSERGVATHGQYKYYGRALDLPGVRDMLQSSMERALEQQARQAHMPSTRQEW